MSDIREEQLRAHPELSVLVGVSALLALLPAVLTVVHAKGPSGPLQDQARSMLRVSRILHDQLNAYMGLLNVSDDRELGLPPHRP